jgi:glycosyltransferase involved in cell wall biosynthesis
MQIAYFYDIPLPSRYAAAIQILNTGRALCEEGATVTIYTNRLAAPPESILRWYGLSPHPALRITPLFADPRYRIAPRQRLTGILHTIAPPDRQVIISRGEPGLALFDHLARLTKPANARYVYESHRLCFAWAAERTRNDSWPWTRRRIAHIRAREQAAIDTADGIVALTAGVRRALEREFAVSRPVLTLPSGVALPPLPLPDDSARDIDILYAGKLERRKGVHDLVAAMQWLPEYRLLIAGGNAQEIASLKRYAAELGVVERITFAGFVEPHAIGALYDRARVGVCPLPAGESAVSEEWTSPLKVLEMMARGVAIVGTDVPALREILEHNRTALLTPPGDPESLAHAMRTLLLARALAGRLTAAARARSEAFSWQQRARRLLAFLHDLG